MAIIYSYPQYAPKPEDLLIGTVTLDENAAVPIYDNPTVSFTIQSLLDMIAPITGAQNLQQVTNIGATTSNTVTFTSDIKVTGRFYDSSGSPGLAGQVLSSTVTGTSWIVNSPASVTSVGLTMPAAFTVANSPITTAGVLAVTGAGTAAQYINGLGNLVTFPTIPTPYVLPVATTSALGGIKIGYTEVGKNYPLELTNEQAFVNVPWTDTVYTLPLAADGTRGGVQIGYVENAKNYPVELSSEKMFVNVPWTDTPYVLPVATSTDLGGVKIGYTENAKNYPVELDSDQMYVNVPWTDTQNPFQTITGAGSNNTDSGVLLSNSGGTVLILGSGSVTAAQAGNTITLTGVDTDTGITGVTLATADSTGAPLSEGITNRELTLTSNKYVGGANVGYVPEGGTGTTYLKGDGTWAAIPTGLQFKGTWDASGGGGGSPDLTLAANKGAGFLWICDVAGTAYPNGGSNPPSTWALGDWAVYDGTAWTRVPATNAGVTSITTTDGSYVDLTPNTATTGAVTVTADLSAQDGTSDTSTKFLSKDNTWDVPSYTTDTNTQNIYTNSWQQSTNDIILRKVLSGAGSGTQDIKIVKGANITFTYTDADNFTITATDTQENTTWYIRDSADADKTVNNLKYLKFVTATGALDTALTGAGTTGDPYLMTLTSPDTNTQNTYTAGAGLSVSNFVFSADIDTTAASSATNNLSTDSGRYYAVQLDNNATAADRKMVVNVPWSSGGTYSWKVRDNASTPVNKTLLTGEFLQFKTATGALATGLAGTGTTADPYVMTLTSPNTTYSNFTAASAGAAGASGLVVAPPAGAQGKFLRGDATWVSVPQGDITEIKVTAPITGAATSGIATIGIDTMGAAAAGAGGAKGAVPASAAGDQAKFLRADATWVVPTDDDTLYALAGAASSTAGEYDLVLSADGTAQDTMVFKEGSNVTFTRAADSLTIAAANDNDNTTYSIDVPAATTNINLKGSNPTSNDAIALSSGTYVDVTRNNASQLTFDLSAVNGTSDTSTRFLSKDNTWDVPSYTDLANETLAVVTGRGATTSTASTFSGGLTANPASNNTPAITTNSALGSIISLGRNALPTNGNRLGKFEFKGYTTSGGNTVTSASIFAAADANWVSSSNYGSEITFQTTVGIILRSSLTAKAGLLKVWGTGVAGGDAKLILNCYQNSHGQTLSAQPHSAGITNTMLLPKGANSTLVSEATETVQSLTTTGTSGASTLSAAGVLNIPQYSDNNDIDYINAATFNTGNGILTGTGVGSAGFSVDLDGRYLTSYTETDTLATVTGRGATTATACSFTNTTSFTVGGSGTGSIYLGRIISSTAAGNGLRFHTNNINAYIDTKLGNIYFRDYADNAGSVYTRFTMNTSTGTFTATGDVVAYSDQRLKTDIKTLDGSKVYKMRGVEFIKDGKQSSGVIAQELEKVAPELVNSDSEYKSVAYGNISGYLIEAIKELKAEIQELKKCNCNKCNCSN